MNKALEMLVSILAGITTLAIVSVLVSRRAATSDVIRAFGGAYSSIISAAVKPVS